MRLPAIVISLFLGCVFAVHAGTQTTASVQFDGEKAYALLVKQVTLGPRAAETPAIASERRLICSELEANGWKHVRQPFVYNAEALGRDVRGENIWAVYPAGKKPKYVISAHYDCRPIADQDQDPSRRSQPIPGANDGASGVAVLLELSRIVPKMKLTDGVGLMFFDGEDSGISTEGFCQGARHMAANLPPELDFQYGVNLDMIGNAQLRLPIEAMSQTRAPELTEKIWKIGQDRYPKVFVNSPGRPVFDDHCPFQEAGKNYVDLIDFDYPEWHTHTDTADKCSPLSLKAVGQVVSELLQF